MIVRLVLKNRISSKGLLLAAGAQTSLTTAGSKGLSPL